MRSPDYRSVRHSEQGPRHFATFYASGSFPAQNIAHHLGEGLALGESALIITTGSHSKAILTSLASLDFDIGALQRSGRLVSIEARTALSDIKPGGKFRRGDFEPCLYKFVEQMLSASSIKKARLTVEMVSLLVEEGNPDEALELEQCWNRISAAYPIQLSCAFKESGFATNKLALGKFSALCDEHDAVVPSSNIPDAIEQTPEWFTLLEAQASALRREVSKRHHIESRMETNESERMAWLELCLQVYKPNRGTDELQQMIKMIYKLCVDACSERAETIPDTPAWYKLTGEIFGYAKVVANIDQSTTRHGGHGSFRC